MVDGSLYQRRATANQWLFAGLFCAVVIAAMAAVVWFTAPSGAKPVAAYTLECPAEYPLMVEIYSKTVCIAGTHPTKKSPAEPG